MRQSPKRQVTRTNLIWVVGVTVGVVAGGVVAYSLASTEPTIIAAAIS